MSDPRWITKLLTARSSGVLARIALTCPFWTSGATKLLDYPGAVAEQAHFALDPPELFAAATIAVQLAGSAVVIAGQRVWLGAGALGVFTALATLIAHPYWTVEGHERFMARNAFFEHLAIIAGLWLAATLAVRSDRSGMPKR